MIGRTIARQAGVFPGPYGLPEKQNVTATVAPERRGKYRRAGLATRSEAHHPIHPRMAAITNSAMARRRGGAGRGHAADGRRDRLAPSAQATPAARLSAMSEALSERGRCIE